MLKYYRYWAKSKPESESEDGYAYHLLPYHCLDVAAAGNALLAARPHFAEFLATETGLETENIKSFLLFFLAMHDMGKFSVTFQNLCPQVMLKLSGRESSKSYDYRHDALGALLWEKELLPWLLGLAGCEVDSSRRLKRFLKIWGAFSFGHHGKPAERIRNPLPLYFSPEDVEAAQELLSTFYGLFAPFHPDLAVNNSARQILAVLKRLSWLLAGFTVICDWIGSNSLFFPLRAEPVPLDEYWQQALPLAEVAVREAGLLPSPIAGGCGLAYLFPQFATTPTPLQAFCNSTDLPAGPQLWVLEDVTGAGKTEAAMLLTNRLLSAGYAEGFYLGLPTMATSNAMYDRMAKHYRKFYSRDSSPSLVLSHGSRGLCKGFTESFRDRILPAGEEGVGAVDEEEGGAQCARWIADSTKKAMLADVGVGTLDQALLGALPAKHQALRLYGLWHKILIVDEVHAYDIYMETLLANLLTGHAAAGGSAILLSATMPYNMRKRLCEAFAAGLGGGEVPLCSRAYPLATVVSGDESVKETPLATRREVRRRVGVALHVNEETCFDIIKQARAAGQCVCWIRNTIFDVLETYHRLREEVPPEDLLVFHSRFALGDRLQREKEVLACFGPESTPSRRKGKVLIASQVVEQSLDLDFDRLLSDLAPMDYLIQRMGRLWRHTRSGRGDAPVFDVFIPEEQENRDWYSSCFPRGAMVYADTANLWRTKELLKKAGEIRMPESARELIEGVYGESHAPVPEVFREAESGCWVCRASEKEMAFYNGLRFGEGYSRKSSDRWDEEINIPTRLGEAQVKVYLVRITGKKVQPFYGGQDSWELSSLKLRKGMIAGVVAGNEERALLEALIKDKFYKEDILLPMDGAGECEAYNTRGKTLNLIYDPGPGLQIEVGKPPLQEVDID